MKKIFIDGKAGTTGLRIYERLSQRPDIEMILLSEEEKEKLSYVYTPSNGKMVITGVWNDKSVTVTGVATIKDNMVTLLFDAQELVALVANTKQYKESSVLQMMGAVINNYPGIKVGFSAKRK